MEPKLLLLIILNVFLGYQQAFFGADFNAAFVSCAVGIGTVGYIGITFGIAYSIGCLVTGYLAKFTNRVVMISGSALVHTCLMVALVSWRPHAGQASVLYAITGLWAFSDSMWIVQFNAYFGILFPGREEAAFANYRLWESVGYIIAFAISPYLRTREKTYFMLTMMAIGMLLYYTVEYKARCEQKLTVKSKGQIREKGADNIAFENVE